MRWCGSVVLWALSVGFRRGVPRVRMRWCGSVVLWALSVGFRRGVPRVRMQSAAGWWPACHHGSVAYVETAPSWRAPYFRVAVNAFRRFSTYRGATFAGVVTNTMFGFVYAFVFAAVHDQAGLIGGVRCGFDDALRVHGPGILGHDRGVWRSRDF